MFVDDPRAEKADNNGTYISNYVNSKHVCIGKPMTIEEAMIERDKDIFAQLQKGDAQRAYYWRNRDKILLKLASKRENDNALSK